MTIPFREWTNFDLATLEGSDADGASAFETAADWTTTLYNYLKLGYTRDPIPWERWDCLIRPSDRNSFASQTSLDTLVDAQIQASFGLEQDEVACVSVQVVAGTTADSHEWVTRAVTGRHYDGENQWDAYPIATASLYVETVVVPTGFPYTMDSWLYSSVAGVVWANNKKTDFFKNGIIIRLIPAAGAMADVRFTGHPLKLKVRYFNPIVNSMSHTSIPTSGVEDLVLTGMGFNNDEDELNENKSGAGVVFDDSVDEIRFLGLQGQGTYGLLLVSGDYTIDSNTQITINAAALEALDLPVGTYDIYLQKDTIAGGVGNSWAYAGDFFCDDEGRIRPGIRMSLLVSDDFLEEEKSQPLLLTKWRFKNFAGEITEKYWSFIDISAPDTFYDGRILDVSSFRRGVNQDKGEFNVSDMTVIVSNADNELSMLLAENFPKNQVVDLHFHWGNRPHARRIFMCRCTIDDISENGPRVSIKIKDITRKYFNTKLPRYICTDAEYADIKEASKGRAMPEILGLCSITDAEAPGATEAICTDTVNFTYLAARRILYGIDEVYSDGVEKTGGGVDYEIYYRDGGRTYIEFTGDQEEKKITFNSKGYAWPDWNSANGYVQNPSYIMAFLLTFLAEIPYEFLHIDSFDILATIFEDVGYDENGHFNSQVQANFDSVLGEMLFCYGAKGFPDKDGRFKVERKALEDYIDSTLILFDQIDLMESASKEGNLKNAVNLANAEYNYHSASSKYYESLSDNRPTSIAAFEAELDGGGIFNFPWTNSENLVQERVSDILDRRSFGERTISLSVSIHHIEDIDIFTDFRFQDPFGLSAEGAGEVGRWCYITSLNYNFRQGIIGVEAIDLSWLLRLYFILGDEDELEAIWADADVGDRMFGYLCDEVTDKFSDGIDGKIIISETRL